MSPLADCEELERLESPAPVHHTSRVRPESLPPASAWVQSERSESRTGTPAESRRLLSPTWSPAKSKSRLQAGLTLGVWGVPKKHTKCPHTPSLTKKPTKTKFQKRKEQVISALRPPCFILTLIFLMVVIHLLADEDMREALEWAPHSWWRQPWRLITYGCVHADTGHLALNALVALAVGWRLELEQGWARVVCVWWGGVAAGALGAGALQPHVRVVGASAGVYALLTAHLPNVCLRIGHIPLWWFRPLSVIVLSATEATWALASSPGPAAVAARAHAPAAYANVAWAAHVFGAAGSVPLAFIVFTGENSSKRYIFVCRLISAVLLAAASMATVVRYIICYEMAIT